MQYPGKCVQPFRFLTVQCFQSLFVYVFSSIMGYQWCYFCFRDKKIKGLR